MNCCATAPRMYVSGNWTCVECNSVLYRDEQLDFSDIYSGFGYNSYKPTCECGAEKTANPNLHAFWCPAYVKP